jgi:outer membrane protein TolC
VSEQEVGNRQSQLDLARSRYNVGLGVPIDVVNAETAKAEAVINLSQARANAEQARINLAILMGIDPRTPLVPAAAIEPPVATNDVNALTRIALTQRPEVVQARYSLRSAQYGVSAARTTNVPAITGGTSIISGGDEFLPQENNLTIGLSITWTPVDGGVTRGLVQQARGNVLIAQQQLIVAQQTAKSDVASAYVNLRTAEQQVPVAIADVANAENGVSIATGRYSTGIGVFLDIINAQAFLLTARTNLVNTQSAVEQYRVALAHAIGAPVSSVR